MNRYLKYGLSSVFTTFFLGITTPVFANGFYAQPAEQTYFNGPYVGLGVGVVSAVANTAKSDYDLVPTESDYYIEKEASSHDFDMGKHGFNGNVFVGYGKTFESSSSYYLGAEIFGNYFSPKLKGSHDIYKSFTIPFEDGLNIKIHGVMTTEVKSPYSFGGDIRAGYLISPRTMLYVLLGLDYAKFEVKSNVVAHGTVGNTNDFDFNITNDFNKWELGYMPGVGIETGLTDHVSLRTQYTYTFYSSLSKTATKSLEYIGNNYSGALDTKVKPSKGLFTVKLSYLFN